MNDATPPPRERLLEAALRLFYDQGYTATGINQIIAEAGVAKASLYDHFPSKEALAEAYLEAQLARWRAGIAVVLAGADSPRARIAALFDFLALALERGLNGGQPFRGCAFLNLATEFPDPAAPIHDTVRAQKEALREAIGEQVALLGAEDGRTADAIFLLFEGALVQMRTFADPWPAHVAREAALALLPGDSSPAGAGDT